MKRLLEEEGQAVIEYGVVAVLVAIAAVLVMARIGAGVSSMLGRALAGLP